MKCSAMILLNFLKSIYLLLDHLELVLAESTLTNTVQYKKMSTTYRTRKNNLPTHLLTNHSGISCGPPLFFRTHCIRQKAKHPTTTSLPIRKTTAIHSQPLPDLGDEDKPLVAHSDIQFKIASPWIPYC